ncbi:pentapeptide repeat-containing protein [Buchananella hordeovulneris]|uniref:pentapeptide repeat-containing protein n=1 Tax=Buchananella hordeovulneris TaxID=52770 RepID=UPI0026DBEB91|nr:pentapeptide repeat-containing protein [Buchananella hordeovulneris]MDO5080010.1 pentapeptide repeat-containing protein [Buchananella hordeovulneris]
MADDDARSRSRRWQFLRRSKPTSGRAQRDAIRKKIQSFGLFAWCAITFFLAGTLLYVSWWIWGFSLEEQSAARATSALSTVAGLGGAVFLVVKYRTQALAERQEAREEEAAKLAKEAAERDKERLVDERDKAQLELTRAKQQNLESRFSEAIRMLGDVAPSTRIAGVYALTDIADSEKGPYKQRVVDILCGYLRTDRLEKDAEGNTRYHLSEDGAPDNSRPISRDGAVESTIIQVMAAHLRATDPHDLEKGSADGSLSGEQLWCACDFDLHEAKITEKTTFSDCTFAGTIALTDAEFYHYAGFNQAHFLAKTLINGTTFHRRTGIRKAAFLGATRLEWMHFHDSVNFSETSFFTEQCLDSSTFQGSADFTECIFHKEADFRGVEFHAAAIFESTKFHGVPRFWGSTFEGQANFMHAEFRKFALFYGSNMAARHASRYSPCTFRDNARFSGAKFHKGASFKATFEGQVLFSGTHFGDHTSFFYARFSAMTDFHLATFSGGARFANTEFSEQPSFTDAIFDRRSEFDDSVELDRKTGLPPGAKWADEVSEAHPEEGESA